MKNNKIYMILANLYDQVKGVIGDTGRNLSEEINERVKNQEEVLAARKGHNSLLEKINAIDHSIDGAGSEVMELSGRVNKTEENIVSINGEIETIKTTNPVVQLENGEHLLVNVEKRPSHRSLEFILDSNDEYRTNADTEHYVTQLFVKDVIKDKEVDLSFNETTSVYDKTKNTNNGGYLSSIQTGEMTIPLHQCLITNQAYDNIAILPEICDIQGITNTVYINGNQHVASAFKTGYQWHIKSKIADILFKFVKPIYITSIHFDFTANTQQQTVAVFEMVGENWVELQRVPATDKKIDILKEVGFIKLTFYSMSTSNETYITVKNVQVKARNYHQSSGIAKVTELIDIYDLSGSATLAQIKEIPNDTICKFALSSTSDEEYFVYYPTKRTLEAGLFENTYGQKVIDKIKSAVNRNALLDYSYFHAQPVGNEGSLDLRDFTWSEDTTFSVTGGWLIDAINYFTLRIRTKDVMREVPINSTFLNKVTKLTIDGVEVFIELKNVSGSLKVAVTSILPIPDVSYVITSLQNLYTSGDGLYTRPYDYSSTSVSQKAYSDFMHILSVTYNARKDHYTRGGWSGNYWWYYDHTTASKYSQSRTVSIVAVDTSNLLANKPICTKNSSSNQYDENIFTIKNAFSSVAYIGVSEKAYEAFNADGELRSKDIITEVTPCNEFIGVLKRDLKQKVTRIAPNQSNTSQDNVEYFLSYNNYNFYTYNATNNAWIQSKTGMSKNDIERIPSYAYDKLFTTENLYIKIKMNDQKAIVNGVDIEFDKEYFKTISENLIPEYGMYLSDIKSISASFLLNLIREMSTLTIAIHSESKLTCWPYLVPNMQLIAYGGISWSVPDLTIAKQFVSGNLLIVKNTSKESKHFRLEQKFFEDKIVVVGDKLQNDVLDNATKVLSVLESQVAKINEKVSTIDQNVEILHDAMLDGTQPPAELPNYLLPIQIEVDIPPLSPGNSVEIPNIAALRNVQYWDNQNSPIKESIQQNTISKFESLFTQENGKFFTNYYELSRTYDTDNAYLMTESVGTSNMGLFSTSEYDCYVRRSDGVTQSPRVGYPYSILSTPNDVNGSWGYWYWASASGNVVYDLPGESARWIDFDFEFKQEKYIHGIFEMDFGGTSASDTQYANSALSFTWQITTIFLDYDGSGNWVEHTKYTGFNINKSLIIGKAVRKLRIRIEVPYSYNRGAAAVAFKHLDFYYCPVRYIHTVDAKITPATYYCTETWRRLLSVQSDASITGTNTDIHYLFEVNNETRSDKKYLGFDGSKLTTKTVATYEQGMLLQQFNNLTEEQLKPILSYYYVRPVAVLRSVDGLSTPQLRSFTFNYSEKDYITTTLVNPQDIITRYDKENRKLIVTNASNATKEMKAIIS